MTGVDPKLVREALASPRWAALTRSGLDVASIGTWDPGLLREARVLVPVDVEALYVPAESQEPMVRLPFALTEPDDQPAAKMPEPFDPGAPREPGVHLHWAMPDALLQGSLAAQPEGATNRLGLAALPDRWLVLRLLAPNGESEVAARGWVVCADRGTVVELAEWHGEQSLPDAKRRTIAPPDLTGSVGGSAQWASIYDAVADRFGFHDPLDDLADLAPQGAAGDQVGYLVSGWWSQPGLDPLDAARTDASLHDLLERMGWHLQEDLEGGHALAPRNVVEGIRRATIGLHSAERYAPAETAQAAGAEKPAAPHNAEAAPAAAPIERLPAADATAAIRAALEPETRYEPYATPFADVARRVVASPPTFPRSALLHGVVHGVPVGGAVEPALEGRPEPDAIAVVLGHHDDDALAAVAADGFGVSDPEARRATERLLAGFSGGLLDRLTTPDGLVEVEEYEHGIAFAGEPGGSGGTDRVKMGDSSAPLTAGAPGRATQARAQQAAAPLRAQVSWAGRSRFELRPDDGVSLRRQVLAWSGEEPTHEPSSELREIERPAPRFHVSAPPILAVRGAKRSLRHRSDGRFSQDGRLRVRWPSQVLRAPSLVDLAAVLPGFAAGAVPEEALALAREAVLTNPYLSPWLSGIAAERSGAPPQATGARFEAESVLRYGGEAAYDGRSTFLDARREPASLASMLVADQVLRHSLYEGVEPDPVGVTAWSQPWIPLWLEWEAELTETDPLERWALGSIDLEPPESMTAGRKLAHRGRSILTTGVATTMTASIEAWLKAEEARDRDPSGEADASTREALSTLRNQLEALDVVSAALDGLREQLLGLPYEGGIEAEPTPTEAPELLARGELRIARARLIDAFGRVLELPDATTPALPAREEVAGPPTALRVRPRLTVPARWLFRLVDPTGAAAGAAEARVDQVDPTQAVNPVAGFLLPDHIDEALEAFDVAGTPLGQLMHEPFGGGVVWEPAPGRPVPADAGPLEDLAPPQEIVGHLAAALVAEDAGQRQGRAARPEDESPLSAMLRAIDTTLWSIDAYAGLGSEHIVGLVGRPIAVVRARLSLQIRSDVDELAFDDPAQRAVREAVYRDLAALAFPVRLGELTRTDDGLFGFFVDDDYSRFHVVDKVVASHALEGGRGKGQLGTYGTTSAIPGEAPIVNPYVVAEDELRVHPGQVVTLTLLMHPAGKVHLTSGVLPRKSLRLARDWVAPGLAVMAPSARIGPVLVDPAKVALPLISAFPKEQLLTRRDTPLTWKDDPILAATQTALLPDLPHEVQEGYIRIAPGQKGSS
ncbi:MAG TPA: hypothetical protein VHU14_06625 [Solirubrobacterales bacterium]|jgi:hypothetical protein|nr:hypothetical protein [Solirubrobacterales bacterium]